MSQYDTVPVADPPTTIRVTDDPTTWTRSSTKKLNNARIEIQVSRRRIRSLERTADAQRRDNKKLQKLVSKLEARLSVLESAHIVDDAECYK